VQITWRDAIGYFLDKMFDGSWRSEQVWNGLAEGQNQLAQFSGRVLPQHAAIVNEMYARMISEGAHIFCAEKGVRNLTKSTGETLLEDGCMSDEQLLSMTYFIEGASAASPTTSKWGTNIVTDIPGEGVFDGTGGFKPPVEGAITCPEGMESYESGSSFRCRPLCDSGVFDRFGECVDDDGSNDSGGEGEDGETIVIDNTEDNTALIAGIGAAAGVLVCVGIAVMIYYKRRIDLAARFANAKLPENVQEVIEEIYETILDEDGGETAQYIPELAAVDPNQFGISLCDLEGNIYVVGDATTPFTIQSACKPILYMLAMQEHGTTSVKAKIGEEPSGQPFDALSIDDHNRAFNPYVNAGAICSASMIEGREPKERYAKFESVCRLMARDESRLVLDETVFKSEMDTNSNNSNIARELSHRQILMGDPIAALEAYTMACSMQTTAEDAAVMGATFANNGRNPLTNDEVLPADLVAQTVRILPRSARSAGAAVAWKRSVGRSALLGCATPAAMRFLRRQRRVHACTSAHQSSRMRTRVRVDTRR